MNIWSQVYDMIVLNKSLNAFVSTAFLFKFISKSLYYTPIIMTSTFFFNCWFKEVSFLYTRMFYIYLFFVCLLLLLSCYFFFKWLYCTRDALDIKYISETNYMSKWTLKVWLRWFYNINLYGKNTKRFNNEFCTTTM